MPIRTERYARAKELFLQTCERPQRQWDAFLTTACGGDEELRREVLHLLTCLEPDDERAGPSTGLAADGPTCARWSWVLSSHFPC